MAEVSPSLRFYLDEVPFSSTQSVKEKRKIKDPQKIPQIHKPKPITKKQTQKSKIPFTKIGYRERERAYEFSLGRTYSSEKSIEKPACGIQ